MRNDHAAIEAEILKTAINELRQRTGASVKHLPIDRNSDIDANLEITFGKNSYPFSVEISRDKRRSQ